MRWHTPLLLASYACSTVDAVFADDAFDLDYHQALIGIPELHTTFFHKPQISSNASLLYSLSDKGVIGAVNPRDGSTLWRQVLSEDPSLNIGEGYLVGGVDGKIFSGYGDQFAAWDAQDGRLAWSYTLASGSVVKGVRGVPTPSDDSASLGQDVILLALSPGDGTGAIVSRVGADTHASKWEFGDPSVNSDTVISVAVSQEHVFYISQSSGIMSGGKTKVVTLDIFTGKEVNQYSVALESIGLGEAGSYLVTSCSGVPFLASSDKTHKSLKLNVLGNSKMLSLSIDTQGEQAESLLLHATCGASGIPYVLVQAQSTTSEWVEVFAVNPTVGEVARVYSLPNSLEHTAFASTSVDNSNYFVRLSKGEVVLMSSESPDPVGRWMLTAPKGDLATSWSHAKLEVSSRGKNGVALRVAALSTGGEWTLIRNGEAQWTRPELLAYITQAIWADDVAAATLVEEIRAEASSNPLTAYVLRLTRHIQDLAYLPQYLMSLPEALLSAADDNRSVRQTLIGGKLILAATSRLELLALDVTNAGAIRWRMELTKMVSPDSTVKHISTDAEHLTAYVSDGTIIVIKIATGDLLEHKKSTKAFVKIVELPGGPAPVVIKVDASGTPEVFSDLAPAVPREGNSLLTINDAGEAVGWTIGSSVQKTWTVKPPVNAKFVDAVTRPSHDPIASVGKVLGDRSVLYKYITPNLAVLTALSTSTLTIYLVNAVTGAVLHTASHTGLLSGFPVSTVISENWFAYTFTSQDAASSGVMTQVVVSELYESQFPNDRGPLSARGNYSSFAADAGVSPYVVSQSFAVAAPIADMVVTQTLQGITSRQVVGYIPNLRAVIGMPRDTLNPRRPIGRDATSVEVEEGLFRYSPVLPLDPRLYLSHTREVIGIKKVMAAPTLLESTGMIFAYGHDIFGTQLAPSTTFDVLGKGFKRFQLVLTIVALYAGVLFLRPMVRKRMVDSRFKF